MPTKANRSSEHDIAYAAMKYLASLPAKSASTSDVKRHIVNFIALTDEDHEEVWQQVVGNIVSHRNDSPDNFINRGLIDYNQGIWSLTEAGEAYLHKHNAYP